MDTVAFGQLVSELSEQPIALCYHCHKCTAGCPVIEEMEHGPDWILRLVQMGEKDRVLSSRDIWLCASCETCGTRCPNEINIAEVMDALRIISVMENYETPEPQAPTFHKLFLGIVNRFGRMHEASLMALFKLRTMDLMSDMDSGAQMIVKGKIPLLPHRVKEMGAVRRIFRETQDQ